MAGDGPDPRQTYGAAYSRYIRDWVREATNPPPMKIARLFVRGATLVAVCAAAAVLLAGTVVLLILGTIYVSFRAGWLRGRR